jgi:rod shape determining protein RodA
MALVYISGGLLMLTMVIGTNVRGSVRWIDVGPIRLQTSEFVKPVILLYLSTWLAQIPPIRFKHLLKVIGMTLIPMALIFIEPDLGTAMIVGAMLLVLIIAAGTPIRYLLILTIIFTLSLPVAYANLRQYQKNRIVSFINPSQDPLGTGYNAVQAMIAVGSGKLFGRGLGQGTQSHLRFLPERHTDFIFAATIEELGYVGGMIMFGAYAWLAVGLLGLARTADSDTGSLIVLGTLGIILAQVT